MDLVFYLLLLSLLIVALLFAAWPLWRGVTQVRSADQTNTDVHRRRLAELAEDAESGLFDPAAADELRDELSRQLLNDLDMAGRAAKSGKAPIAAVLVASLFSVVAVFFYAQLGGGAGALNAGTQPSVSSSEVAAMVQSLADRLAQDPSDGRGWYLLGRSYFAMARYEDAKSAYENAREILGDDAALLTDLAEVSAIRGELYAFEGRPRALIEQALTMTPDLPKALWLGGLAASQAGEYQTAVSRWQALITQNTLDPEANELLREQIAIAREKGGLSAPADPALDTRVETGLEVAVSLDPSIADAVQPNDTVFVFARAVEGPPMPLAVARVRVRDLPLNVRLDDSMAMTDGLRLSNFEEVLVTARISRTHSAQAQTGDPYGQIGPVSNWSETVLHIDIRNRTP